MVGTLSALSGSVCVLKGLAKGSGDAARRLPQSEGHIRSHLLGRGGSLDAKEIPPRRARWRAVEQGATYRECHLP